MQNLACAAGGIFRADPPHSPHGFAARIHSLPLKLCLASEQSRQLRRLCKIKICSAQALSI